jgi:glycosyltransferase involved in cell wall biosynthesis
MRIAIIAPLVTAIREPQLGGSQAFVADLAVGLQNRGHDVDVYAASDSVIPGVRVVDTGVDARSLAGVLYRHDGGAWSEAHSMEANARLLEWAFDTVYRSVGKVPYDIVHNHGFDPPAVRLATRLRSAVVHTLHLPPDRAMAAAIVSARRSENPPTIAAVSAHQGKAWETLGSVDVVLPDGVPVERIPLSAVSGEGVVFAGRFSAEKGAEDAIAIARAAKLRIDLYGEAYDPDYARDHVFAHQGEPGVTIHGGLSRTELWDVMAEARAVLCPAKWEEPFGMVAAEAQAAGTPVIAYRRGALPEVIRDGETGFLVPPDDVQAAARALGAVGSIDRRACRHHAAKHLSLDASLAVHERLYQRLQLPAKVRGRG